MKNFTVIFLAVLCAIVVSVLGLIGYVRISSWSNMKEYHHRTLENQQLELEKSYEILNSYEGVPMRGPSIESRKALIHEQQVAIARTELTLLRYYDSKLLPLTSDESAEASQWSANVRELLPDEARR